nr:immunoglobulin light chain junction region [Macaca mulatta]
CQQESIWPMF